MSPSKPVKVAFYEVEKWEGHHLTQALPGQQLLFYTTPLDEHTLGGAGDAEIISVFIHSFLTKPLLERLPKLRFVATRSTGVDHLDLSACNERGIVVSNVPYYGETTVAEHTFGLILALSRNIHKAYVRTVRGDFSLQGLQGFDLRGKTLGIIGAGNIGLHVIRIAKGFGMEVLAYDPKPNHLVSEVLGFQYASLDDLLRRSGIISLHAPYLPQTHHLINKENVKLIKPGALLINTARGGLVDTEAMLWALDNGILAGAGLDVLEGEELIQEEKQLLSATAAEEKMRMLLRQHALLRREDVVVTPHIAFYSREALQRIVDTTVENIQAFLEGRPQNVVNGAALRPAGAATRRP